MAQTAMTVRLDADVKMKFDSLCEQFGMSANTAFNIFVNAVVRSRSIPFAIVAPEDDSYRKAMLAVESLRENAAENGVAEMSIEEINEEISSSRKARGKKE